MQTLVADWQEKIPLPVKEILHTLQAHGYLAYIAGGAVRDLYWGLMPKDFDIATTALPEQIEALFPKTLSIGKKFGIIAIVTNEMTVEVATFRKEGEYRDSRHPDGVSFCGPDEDALRRDFTINALFWDSQSNSIIDFIGGLADLDQRKLKTVGQARERFSEDALRMMRAIRFYSQHSNLTIDSAIPAAVLDCCPLLKKISKERITQEFTLLLSGPHWLQALHLISDWKIWDFLCDHPSTNLIQKMQSLAKLQEMLRNDFPKLFSNELQLHQRLALFHPDKHFIFSQVLSRKAFNARKLKNVFLSYSSLNLAEKKRLWADEAAWLAFAFAFIEANDFQLAKSAAADLQKWIENSHFFPPLYLSGNDLIAMGVSPGKSLGEILFHLETEVLSEKITSREIALQWAKNYISLKK